MLIELFENPEELTEANLSTLFSLSLFKPEVSFSEV